MIVFDGDTRRAIAAAGLTQSDNDGEAINALRVVQRHLAEQDLTLQDIVRKSLTATPVADPFGGQPSYAPRRSRPFRAALSKPWQRDAITLLRWPSFQLSEKEQDFAMTMRDRRIEPTEKQSAWLSDLMAKARREAMEVA